MGYTAAINYLYGLQKHGIKLGLDTTAKLLFLSGNPQNHFSSVHIAGTNGKGSTSVIIASILQAAGFRTGLFTSPHLVSFTERIRVNNEEIAESDVVSLAEEIRFKIQDSRFKMTPTFFEFVTAMGLLYFKRKNIDWAVVETGMGGRLDATNVLLPEASVITSINYDHSEFLGNTISAIAEEKAGIIKDGVPVITSAQEPSVMDAIKKKTEEKNASLFIYGRDFSAAIKTEDTSGSVFNYNGGNNFEDLVISLPGRHQVLNAALALKTIEVISQKPLPNTSRLNPDTIRAGLGNIKWQGRLEFISKEPPILIDGAHNPSAATILADSLKEIFFRVYRRIILVVGIMSDKDIRGIMAPLLPLAAEIILTAPAYERAASPDVLYGHAISLGFSCRKAYGVADALTMAREIYREGDLIVITGSFYTIGEAKEMLCGRGILSGLRETI
ncbi:MAG: folylpolyglutamate synthase/dihydrofolate synthase family protein [Thermodesulfovibrionales bacterium]|nr:folylpolyglutamate synthase/dihydrofolate synthase family protein [Thermodesulfovibrionales bacterium]